MTRNEMLASIDAKAGAVRACYITAAPGQESTYLLKSAQAWRFKDNGYAGSPPNLVQAEAEAIGKTPRQACDQILAEEEQWTALAAAVELVRRKGKVAIKNAASELDAEQACNQTLAILKSMMG